MKFFLAVQFKKKPSNLLLMSWQPYIPKNRFLGQKLWPVGRRHKINEPKIRKTPIKSEIINIFIKSALKNIRMNIHTVDQPRVYIGLSIGEIKSSRGKNFKPNGRSKSTILCARVYHYEPTDTQISSVAIKSAIFGRWNLLVCGQLILLYRSPRFCTQTER